MSSNNTFLDKRINKKLDAQIQQLVNRVGIDRKTLDEVFDTSTLLSLEKIISNRIIDYIDFPISTGKEGNVFLAITPEKKPVALKIYRISTATFKHITKYISGDPRFQSIHKSRRDITYAWAAKEIKNLEKLQQIKIPSPKPILRKNNVLIMQYIGTKHQPAPLLKDVKLNDPEKTYQTLLQYIKKMYHKANLVHCDFSPYNLLLHKNKIFVIDLGQGVLLDHPQAHQYLLRDIRNITNYFKKYDIKEDPQSIYQNITGKRAE